MAAMVPDASISVIQHRIPNPSVTVIEYVGMHENMVILGLD